jgi:hypothetical protein
MTATGPHSNEGAHFVERAVSILEAELEAASGQSSAAPSSRGQCATAANVPAASKRRAGDSHSDASAPPDVWHALTQLLKWAEAAAAVAATQPASPGRAPLVSQQLASAPPPHDAIFRAAGRSRAGQSIEIILGLVNEQRVEPVEVQLFCTDLVAGPGRHIAAERITFEPAALWLAAQSSADVMVRVDVPPSAAPGLYAGLLRATNLEDLKAIVMLCVE